MIFLLTHLMRGATISFHYLIFAEIYFYSHTSCEVRHMDLYIFLLFCVFLLTHLMRGATYQPQYWLDSQKISTHTPHARCDCTQGSLILVQEISTHTPHARCDCIPFPFHEFSIYFYSHTSCEVRPPPTVIVSPGFDFYSHTSCEVRRCGIAPNIPSANFYSHTSCEVRLSVIIFISSSENFYSHTSCEVRLVFLVC